MDLTDIAAKNRHFEWSNTPDRQKAIKEFNVARNRLREVQVADLQREGKDFTFEGAVPYIARMDRLVEDIHSYEIERLPLAGLEAIRDVAKSFVEVVDQIDGFSANGANPGNQHRSLLLTAKQRYDEQVPSVAIWIGFLATLGDKTRLAAEQSAQLIKQIEAKRDEVDGVLKAAQEAAAKIGSAATAQAFAARATKCEDGARTWLVATVGMVVATGILAFHFLAQAKSSQTGVDVVVAIQIVAARVVAVSIASFATVWASRNYRSERHNQTINLHRAHAMQTFEAFAKGAGDDEATKNALLLEAASAAFGARLSGYESPDAMPPMPSAPISVKLPAVGGS